MISGPETLSQARWITIQPDPELDGLALRGAEWIGPAGQDAAIADRLLATACDIELPEERAIRSATIHFWVEGRSHFDDTFDVPGLANEVAEWGFFRVNGCSETLFNALTRLLAMRAPARVDITHLLVAGTNHLAFLSWMTHDQPAVIAALEIVFTDGGTQRFVSDSTWRCGMLTIAEAQALDWHARLDALTPCAVRCRFGAEPWNDIRARLNLLPAPVVLQRRFILPPKPIAAAWIDATAIGVYDMELNGDRVGEVFLAPGWTDTRKTAHVQRYDVGSQVRPGDNHWSATVAKGWIGSPMQGCAPMREDTKALRAVLVVRYADGETLRIATEATGWEGGDGAVRDAEIYDGEIVDRTHAPIVRPVIALPERETVCLPEPCSQPRVIRELSPISLTPRDDGVWVVDFGQNFAGVVRLQLDEPHGTRIVVRHAEMLRKDGALMRVNLRAAACTDTVVCDGQPFVFQPRFTVRGFRYVEIAGLGRPLQAEHIRGIALSSVTHSTFDGECALPRLNQLIEMIRWTQRSNWLSVPSDCPQRSERLGWMCDNQVYAPSGLLLFDGKDFQRKHLDDLYESAHENGSLPDFAPCGGGAGPLATYGWADAGVTLPHAIWQIYGDLGPARRHWRGLRAYLAHRDATADAEGLNVTGTYGDWLTIEPKTPHAILGPIQQALTHRLAAELAGALGDDQAVVHHQRRFAEIGRIWRQRHLRTDGTIESDTQSVYLCAWHAGLIPADARPAVTRALRATFARADDHLRTGIIGTACLLDVLVEAGLLDIAWRVLTDDTFPSYGYFLKNGATTLPEWWDPWPGAHETTEYWATFNGDRAQNECHGSLNHPVFGSIFAGIFKYVWGLRQAPQSSGFRSVIIQPRFTDQLAAFSGTFCAVAGTYQLAWRMEAGVVHYRVVVPEGCTATLIPPRPGAASIILEAGVSELALAG